jgi:hypothetical protein
VSSSVQRSVLELRAAVRQARGDAVHVWTGHLSAVLGRLQATEREVAAIRRLPTNTQLPSSAAFLMASLWNLYRPSCEKSL